VVSSFQTKPLAVATFYTLSRQLDVYDIPRYHNQRSSQWVAQLPFDLNANRLSIGTVAVEYRNNGLGAFQIVVFANADKRYAWC
jgi:hypothetical protein